MEAVYRVGQKVAVNIGGRPENRAEGVITSINTRPELTTYEVAFKDVASDGRVHTFYMAHDLQPL